MDNEYREQLATTAAYYRLLIVSDGWKMALAWYQTKIQSFTNDLIFSSDKEIQSFAPERYKLMGVREFMAHVTETIEEDDRLRKQERDSSPGK